jgi:hypothetical protein
MEHLDQIESSTPRGSILRIGLLVDGTSVSKYVYALAKWAADRSDIHITHLVIHGPYPAVPDVIKVTLIRRGIRFFARVINSAKKRGIFHTLSQEISHRLFGAIERKERRLLVQAVRHKDHADSFDLSSLVPNSIAVTPIISKSGFVYRFDGADVAKVRDLGLDLLIRCGNGILRGGILRASRLGILSFHHADNRINRGGPAGFWEVYLRQDTTGFTLQRLTEELDGGEVLMRGYFRTSWYYLSNQAMLYEKSNHYLMILLEQIARKGQLPNFIRSTPYAYKLFRAPTFYECVVYMINIRRQLTKRFFRKLMGIDCQWDVAYCRSDWPNAVLWRGIKLEAPQLHFVADPFVVSHNDEEFCFVEEFSYLQQRGKIAVYNITERSFRVGTALDEAFHLSFPFLFYYKNQLFMCPESCQRKEIRIYRCVAFPLNWILERIIMRDVDAADTMLFEKDGRWWMFTNIDPVNSRDHCSELFIFSSDSPLSTEWAPHVLNPIIVDASRARNGGLLRDGIRYFRVSQSHTLDVYGRRACINEIIELTDASYLEVPVGEITPNFRKGILGTHHLHSNGKSTVWDFVTDCRVFGAREVVARIKQAAQRRFRRMLNRSVFSDRQ